MDEGKLPKKRKLTEIEKRSIETQTPEEITAALVDDTSPQNADAILIDLIAKLRQPDLFSVEIGEDNKYMKIINKSNGEVDFFSDDPEEIEELASYIA